MGKKGGAARAAGMTAEQRSEIAKKDGHFSFHNLDAAKDRGAKPFPAGLKLLHRRAR
jgi:hypothetical protein